MKSGYLWTTIALLSLMVLPAAVHAEPAHQAFADGKSLLARGDFSAALGAFAQAARADRDNQVYLQQYTMIRQIVMLRKQLGTEKNGVRWEYIARGLHSFYVGEGLYREALALDQKIHARLNTASSAVLLAETQLAMDRNAEAAQTLAGLPAAKQTPSTKALHGLALARQGQRDEAQRIAASVSLASQAGPGLIYRAARLHAAVENDKEALGLLTRCFELVAPSRLDGFKEHARQSPEFVSLVSTPAFAQAMQTKSKVPESKCSGGSKCAGCPMRGNCSKSQGQ